MPTLLVNPDLCTRCGRCSAVCPMAIVSPAGKNTLPTVKDEAAGRCIRCGHCEAFCPTQALLLNVRPDEKTPLPAGAGNLAPDDLRFYLKKRRSIRRFAQEPVSRETILEILDVARYAASGGNGQPVQWLVVNDPQKIRKIAEITIAWMRTLLNTPHPLSSYLPRVIAGWEAGFDVICLGAPHLLFAHIPNNNPIAAVDAIITLTHVDVAAPAFGVGTCWAGFVAAAATNHEPLRQELGLPAGRKFAYAMMLGHPKYKATGIPRRNSLAITWQ
jgi:nitroreductase/NAD-dependent dihydropyrimidine dehydrogenase PreA subunit